MKNKKLIIVIIWTILLLWNMVIPIFAENEIENEVNQNEIKNAITNETIPTAEENVMENEVTSTETNSQDLLTVEKIIEEIKNNNMLNSDFNMSLIEGENKGIRFSSEEENYIQDIIVEIDNEKEQITLKSNSNISTEMTYEEFTVRSTYFYTYKALIYTAVAHIQGLEHYENAIAYLLIDGEVINYDSNQGITEKNMRENPQKYYPAYLQYIYGEKWNKNDKTTLNTYEWQIDIDTINANEYSIKSKMIINLNGDFKSIEKRMDEFFQEFQQSFEEGLRNATIEFSNNNSADNEFTYVIKPENIAERINSTNMIENEITVIPQTGSGYGIKDIIQILIFIILIALVGMVIRDAKKD